MKLNCKTIAMIFATIILALCSVACAPANEVVLASTPEPTATPTVSPTPTPTFTPSPTPMPELTYEQKKMLLGVDEDFEPTLIGSLIVVELSFGNVTGRIWGITYGDDAVSSRFDFHSVCNDEYLFTIDMLNNRNIAVGDYPNYLYDWSPNLVNLKLINSTALSDMARTYKYGNISYNNCQEIKDIFSRGEENWEKTAYTVLSTEQIVDLIIQSTPQEKIIPFWVYTPGATIPDELKGIYSEAEYPPVPAATTSATIPSLTPTPAPLPEMTMAQKELLLGNKDSELKIGNIIVYNYTLNGKNYRSWAYGIDNEERTRSAGGALVRDMFDIFSSQYLFSIQVPTNSASTDGSHYSVAHYADYLSQNNPALRGVSLVSSQWLSEVAEYYKTEGIGFNDDAFLKELSATSSQNKTEDGLKKINDMRETRVSIEQYKQAFLNSTPQEEILPLWVFTPGAQIPEELKGIYSEADYPPAPAE